MLLAYDLPTLKYYAGTDTHMSKLSTKLKLKLMTYEYSMMLYAMHQHTRSRTSDAGRARAGNTNGESKIRCLEREGTVGVREEEHRWPDGEQEGWSSPRCRMSNRDRVEPGPNTDKEELEARKSRLEY
jgi:hypothetical protein